MSTGTDASTITQEQSTYALDLWLAMYFSLVGRPFQDSFCHFPCPCERSLRIPWYNALHYHPLNWACRHNAPLQCYKQYDRESPRVSCSFDRRGSAKRREKWCPEKRKLDRREYPPALLRGIKGLEIELRRGKLMRSGKYQTAVHGRKCIGASVCLSG